MRPYARRGEGKKRLTIQCAAYVAEEVRYLVSDAFDLASEIVTGIRPTAIETKTVTFKDQINVENKILPVVCHAIGTAGLRILPDRILTSSYHPHSRESFRSTLRSYCKPAELIQDLL